MTNALPKGYRWQRFEEGYFELRPAHGKTLAEVTLIEESKRWAWYVHMPEAWFAGANPYGLAYSADSAKAICEAIVQGTLDPARPD